MFGMKRREYPGSDPAMSMFSRKFMPWNKGLAAAIRNDHDRWLSVVGEAKRKDGSQQLDNAIRDS